jgi:hypothetical protein
MAIRSSVNQVIQLGVESTPGSPVACSKLLQAFAWTLGAKPTTKQYRGTGRQYPSASTELMEYASGKISGPGDFNQLLYPISSVLGKVSPVAHGASSTAKDWIFVPGLTGSYAANAQTYTLQNGDSNDAEQYAFAVFTGFSYSFTRKQEVTIGGELIAQTFTDAVTLTASPTEVAQSPMTGAQANVYLDSSSANLGTTLLTNLLKCDFAASGYYDPFWPVNRANTSFTNIVDKEKKNELKLLVEANSTNIALRGTYLQVGARCYVRVNVQGPVIDSPNSINATLQHDMACFVTNMAEFSDSDGVYAVEYTLAIAEDTAWGTGQAQKLTLTNLITAL